MYIIQPMNYLKTGRHLLLECQSSRWLLLIYALLHSIRIIRYVIVTQYFIYSLGDIDYINISYYAVQKTSNKNQTKEITHSKNKN